MAEPVNLNIPGFEHLFFALLFFTVVLVRAELALQQARQARTIERNLLLESQRSREVCSGSTFRARPSWSERERRDFDTSRGTRRAIWLSRPRPRTDPVFGRRVLDECDTVSPNTE
jgi:hypothetical protein